MDKRKIIVDYLRDESIKPPYYSMRKDWIIEYSWEHWATEEIYYRLYHSPNQNEKEIIESFIKDMEMCLSISKRKQKRGDIIFTTAIAVGREIESLLRAMEENNAN